MENDCNLMLPIVPSLSKQPYRFSFSFINLSAFRDDNELYFFIFNPSFSDKM